MKDIFLNENFQGLYETVEDGKREVFEFHLPIGKVRHSFIKREISVQIDGEVYYDITTTSSYGGPVVYDCNEEDKWELVDEFQRAFQAYCEENKIVSEYVRFDPVQSNVLDFVCIYEVECIGKIRGISRAVKNQAYMNVLSSEDIEKSFDAKNNEGISDFSIYIGKKIWNEETYREVCAAVQIGADADFFPAYRYKDQTGITRPCVEHNSKYT